MPAAAILSPNSPPTVTTIPTTSSTSNSTQKPVTSSPPRRPFSSAYRHPPTSALLPFRPPPLTPRFMIQSRGKTTQTRARELPAGYRGAERKVRTVMVALPVVIVTSWVLYNRLVKGEERKTFAAKNL